MNTHGLQLADRVGMIVRDDVSPEVCEAYVTQHPQASSYHRPAWLDVIRAAFGHETRYLAAETPDGLAGVLPLVFFNSRLFGRFAVSLPFVNYGGVLADHHEAERALLARAIEDTGHAGGAHLELRHSAQHFSDLAAKRHKVAMELLLQTSVDAQWSGIDRKLRNQVRKAEKSALECVSGGCELLSSFYEVFATNMRDLGTPVYSRRFFHEVLSVFPEHTRVFVVRLNGRPIAASIVHWHRDRIEVPWASSLREFNALCGNVLLVLGHAALCRGAPVPRVRLRPLHAGRRHFPVQEAMGRRGQRAGVGILDRAWSERASTQSKEPEIRSGHTHLAAAAAQCRQCGRTTCCSQHPVTPMLSLLVASLVVLLYVYAGYPALLSLLVRVRKPRPIRRADSTPSLSMVISAYNEADVIRRKLENALALSYPRPQFELVVVSDASDDGTDDIVAEYASQGVRLVRQDQRRGKTAGLNRTVPTLRGDIVVFSDANAMYESDALLKLARNFADRAVGCVTGEARYVSHGWTTADVGERAYWNYEIELKRAETAVGSMVGGDGAIYAIRRSLWQTLPDDAINDFLNPLQIVAAGWRGVYEPEAVCWEDTAGGIRTEYRRRVRIVSRSWRAVFQAPGVLNPLRVGLFTWSLLSHKVLRWMSGMFLAFAAIAAGSYLIVALREALAATLGTAAAAGVLLAGTPFGRRVASMAGYFVVINAASTVGVVKGSIGKVSGVWSTPRQHPAPAAAGRLLPVGKLLQAAALVAVIVAAVVINVAPIETVATLLFWGSAAVLGYVYAGYPALLGILGRFASWPVKRGPVAPHVCVVIAANDEESVIEAKLHNTLRLEYPVDRLAIIVASDGSTDGTNDIVRRFAGRVRLLEFSPRRGKISTINEAMRHVTSDIVVFSDANTFLESNAITALVQNFADPSVGGVSGDVALIGERAALGRSEDLYYRYERWVQRAESQLGSMVGADGALYAIRRALFVPPAADTILDDMAIPMAVVRAGYRVVYEPAARAVEQGSDTAREEFSRKVRVIAGATQFIRRSDSTMPAAALQLMFSLVSHKALRWLSPAFVAATLTSSLLLASSSWWYATAAGVQISLLMLGLLGCSATLRRINVIAIAHYFFLVQAAAAVGFVRGLMGRQSVLWRRFDRVSAQTPARLNSSSTAPVVYTHE